MHNTPYFFQTSKVKLKNVNNIMTKTKALKILNQLIEAYGKDHVLYKFFDKYLYEIDYLKERIDEKHHCYVFPDEKKYHVASCTLQDLYTLVEHCEKLTDEFPLLDNICLIDIIRQCNKNIDVFKTYSSFPVIKEESQKAFFKFCKENEESLKKYRENIRQILNMYKRF